MILISYSLSNSFSITCLTKEGSALSTNTTFFSLSNNPINSFGKMFSNLNSLKFSNAFSTA